MILFKQKEAIAVFYFITLTSILGNTTTTENYGTVMPVQPIGKSAELSPDDKVIEVFVWSAPDVFRYHKQRLGLSKTDTDIFLRSWEKVLIREADLMFRKFLSVNLRLYYAGGGGTSNLNVAWYRLNTDGDFMDGPGALSRLQTYFVDLQNSGDIPQADHIVVLTRKDLADDTTGTNSFKIAYSTDDTICRNTDGSSVGLAEMTSPRFLKGIAQSILFGLGLVYQNSNVYRVMSSFTEVVIPETSRVDRWTLDSTSENLLALRINNGPTGCLNNQQPGFDFADFLSVQTYGATYDLDAQCSILFGSGSASCNVREARLCFDGQTCTDPVDGTCTRTLLAGDRTTCAVNTGCRYGFCTFTQVTTPVPPTPTTTVKNLASTTTEPATTTEADDCCCERRPLGRVVVRTEYIPC